MFNSQVVLHYPRLDTETCIKKAKKYPSRMQLWRLLPKKVQYQTFKVILNYLVESRKIFITKEGKIMWILADSKKSKKLLEESTPYARTKTVQRV
ncbi:MAG: hypothetical protein ACE5DI_03415 [Candidatus Micrarchaeia archaeon]